MRIGASVGPELEDIEKVSGKFDFVEIAIGEMEVAPEEIDVESLKDRLEEKDLDLVVHLPFRQPLVTTVPEFNEASYKYFDRLLEFSSDIGAEKAVVHFNIRHGEDQEDLRPLVEKQIKEFKVLENKHGVELVYENLPFGKSRAVDLEDIGPLAEELDFSVCLDTGHAYAESGQEVLNEFLDQHLETVSHFHIQDSMGGEDSHVAVGHGDIEWEEVGKRIEDFEGTLTLEIFTSDFEYQELSREKLLDVL